MHRSYVYGLLVITAVVAAAAGVFGGKKLDEASVLAVRIPEPMSSTSLDPALMKDRTNAPTTTAPFVEHDFRASRLLTTTTTLATTTTAVPTTTHAPTEQPATTQPKNAEPEPSEPSGGFNGGYESDFAASINSLRSSQGLAGLSRDGSLDGEARAWAKRMAERGSISHSDIGRLLPPWSAAAENVGMGGSVSSVFGALANSSGHLANMVGGYTHFGVGVWVDSSGALWTTHLFTG